MAIRYNRVATVLHSFDQIELIMNVRTLSQDDNIYDSKILPGLPFVLVGQEYSLDLFSTETGSLVESLIAEDEMPLYHGRLSVASSEKLGLGPLVLLARYPREDDEW
jgi:hypothetical protein